jgi:hypothetical protein
MPAGMTSEFCAMKVFCQITFRITHQRNQGHLIQRAHWARAQGPLSQGGPQAVDDHLGQ